MLKRNTIQTHISLLVLFIYCIASVSAMNKVNLKNGMQLSSQLTSSNTIYIIEFSFDLAGKTINIPNNSTLFFLGGALINGTIILNNTNLINPSFRKVHFKGSTPVDYFNISDYGAISGANDDCSVLINELISLKSNDKSERNSKTIHIPNGTFYLKSPIQLWAGWEAPVTLEGNGNTSTLCQTTNNEYILKVFECHYIKNLRLTYKQSQDRNRNKSVAIACQRSIFCNFENLTISKSHSAFGYISLGDQSGGFNPTKYKQQCYVSCNFRNIRIYECSGFALDFKKEIPQGDSGSVFDNIYINCLDWGGGARENISRGAFRGDNTMASFSQLNVEGPNYNEPLIYLSGMSRVSIQSFHIEALVNTKSIAKTTIQSALSINILDIQSCSFKDSKFVAFDISDSGLVNVQMLTIRQDCKRNNNSQAVLTNNSKRFLIRQLFDSVKLF